jgi:hypothetical protein
MITTTSTKHHAKRARDAGVDPTSGCWRTHSLDSVQACLHLVCSRGELYTLVTRRADIQHKQPLGITCRTCDTDQIQQVAIVCGYHGVGTRFGFHSAQFVTRQYTVLAYSCQPPAASHHNRDPASGTTQTGLHGSHWQRRFYPAMTHDVLDSTLQSWTLLPGI